MFIRRIFRGYLWDIKKMGYLWDIQKMVIFFWMGIVSIVGYIYIEY